jgi:hypothetical protein
VSEPRPQPDSEVAGGSEYGNDTGFAAAATGPSTGDAGPGPEAATEEDADDSDPGRGAD